MGRSATTEDAQALFQSLRSAYAATPNHLRIIDLYVLSAVFTAVIQASMFQMLLKRWNNNNGINSRVKVVGTLSFSSNAAKGVPLVYFFLSEGMYPYVDMDRAAADFMV